MEIVEKLLNGDRIALSRLITLVENNLPGHEKALSEIYKHTGNAFVIGVTGAPGSGKSTLVDKLTPKLIENGKKVGIIAIDPTSPFTGGALLGDRIRMQDLYTCKDVFIRSVSTRGSLGGISRCTNEIIHLMDAFGKDIIIVETVGVGQGEIDIVKYADTTVVVMVPGMGDDIQTIKAGILEIGDIFVVNKADRESTEKLVSELGMMLELNNQCREWKPPIIRTVATEGEGIEDLANTIFRHYDYLQKSESLKELRVERARMELEEVIMKLARDKIFQKIDRSELNNLLKRIASREISPYTAADLIFLRAKGA